MVLPKKSAEKGIQVNQIVLIVDLEGVTVKSMKNSGAYKLMKYLTKITQVKLVSIKIDELPRDNTRNILYPRA